MNEAVRSLQKVQWLRSSKRCLYRIRKQVWKRESSSAKPGVVWKTRSHHLPGPPNETTWSTGRIKVSLCRAVTRHGRWAGVATSNQSSECCRKQQREAGCGKTNDVKVCYKHIRQASMELPRRRLMVYRMSQKRLPADSAIFPSLDDTTITDNPLLSNSSMDSSWTHGRLYMQPPPWEASQPRSISMKRPLRFPSISPLPPPGDSELDFPSIQQYLPPGADADAVGSLVAVYRSHCLLAIDNFRFCKTDKLCDSYKSLVGLLTVPGQKLLAHPKIAPWIQECDWYKYQKMIPMLDKIVLTQVPQKAMAHMEHVGKNLCNWIYQYFMNQPQHVQDAMLGPTNVFVSIIDRFLRVNRATSDVAAVFEDPESRDQLWIDWVNEVEPRKVVQNSLGATGHKRCLTIITEDVRRILQPQGRAALHTGPEFPASKSSRSDAFDSNDRRPVSIIIIERLVHFLVELPTRFPRVDARTLLNYISIVGSSISRNLTLNSTQSLGNWWRINLFIDEMSHWLAEKGGFLEGTANMLTAPQSTDLPPSFSTMDSYHFDSPSNNDFPPSRPRTSASNAPHHSSFSPTSAFPTKNHAPTDSHSHPSRNPDVFHDMPHLPHAPSSSSVAQTSKHRHHADPAFADDHRHKRRRSQSTVAADDDGPTGATASAPLNDDSGIGLADDDTDFAMDAKYQSFVESAHASDPADVVVC